MWGLFPRGWRCCVPALLTLTSSALRFSLLLGNLLFSNFPLATTTISKSPPPPPPPPISHFFSNNNVVYSDRSEKLKKKLAIFFETPAACIGFLEPY
jgi:hypothetical protein